LKIHTGIQRKDPGENFFGLILIALLKLVEGLLLLAASAGALSMINRDMAAIGNTLVLTLGLNEDSYLVHRILNNINLITNAKLVIFGTGSFVYAGLLITEGVGLLLKKLWAEYMTVFVTASFIPYEIYEIIKHITLTKSFVFLLNVLIVLYLAGRLRNATRKEYHVSWNSNQTPTDKENCPPDAAV
jgi:uncharacterized membrane protein (DUF2068 family)